MSGTVSEVCQVTLAPDVKNYPLNQLRKLHEYKKDSVLHMISFGGWKNENTANLCFQKMNEIGP